MQSKIVKILAFSLIIGSLGFSPQYVPETQARISAYYSGDAAVYRGRIIIGSANMGRFELFRLEGDNILKTSTLRPEAGDNSQFYDLKFSEEKERLNVYLTSGRYLYKYDITDVFNPVLVNKIKDNTGDGWTSGFDKSSAGLVTIGTKEIKVWNDNLEIIDSFKITNVDNPHNIRFSADGKYIVNARKDKVEIFNAALRKITAEIPVKSNEAVNRKIYAGDYIYVADDESVRVFDYSAREIKSFKHTSKTGYDVDAIPGERYVYFSDGIGIVKLDKDSLRPVDWVNIDKISVPYGWAMGIKALKANGSNYTVAFCNSYIGIFDNNLDLVSYHRSEEETFSPVEQRFLKIDKDRAASGSLVSIHGGGYGQLEKVRIDFAGYHPEIITDEQGRFSVILEVPYITLPRPYISDIKVTGLYTGISYNLKFTLE